MSAKSEQALKQAEYLCDVAHVFNIQNVCGFFHFM
jgi:hypothetical protein